MLTKLQRLANAARVDDSDGFTLIELLIVVVIIGILAAIAIPQFSSTKEKAYDATAKSDVRNLMTAQEGHFANYNQYANSISTNSSDSTTVQFRPSSGVGVGNMGITLQNGGYVASATHSQSTNCFGVTVGDTTGGSTNGEVTQDGGDC